MLNFSHLFGVFSRRQKTDERDLVPLTPECRNRILMLCRDTFFRARNVYLAEDAGDTFLGEIHQRLTYLYGKHRLVDGQQEPTNDVLAFLATCSDEHFLDFVELIFDVDCYDRMCPDENIVVEQINQFLSVDNLPYWVTRFVRENKQSTTPWGDRQVSVLTARPKVIRKDDEVVHQQAIEPVLTLLAQPRFTAANLEFLDALTDFKKMDFRDCLVKCGSAFESMLKVIHDRNGWAYSATDTASPLLRSAITKAGIEAFFEQPLILVATMRNKLSAAHGGGTKPRHVDQATAKFAVNATAAAMLFLEERCP